MAGKKSSSPCHIIVKLSKVEDMNFKNEQKKCVKLYIRAYSLDLQQISQQKHYRQEGNE
jgi:hypothetical protein